MNKKFLLIFACLIAVLIMTGCAPGSIDTTTRPPLEITGMVTSLGGEPDDVEQGIYSYTITLANNTDSRFTITGIEPVLSEAVGARLVGQTHASISVTVEPQESATVSGTLRFNFEGLSKQDIMALEPFITHFQVNGDTLVPAPPGN
jgi:hypothetical protein